MVIANGMEQMVQKMLKEEVGMRTERESSLELC